MRTIRIVWDFRGPHAEQTAIHHAKHLKEFLVSENYQQYSCDISHESENYSYCFIDINESELIFFRDTLRPMRALVVE